MSDKDDGFDSMTRSGDKEFHQWALDNLANEDEHIDIDRYEDAELAWTAGQQAAQVSDCVYELCDTTDDEMYFPLGMFRTVEEAKAVLAKYEESGEAITEHGRNMDTEHEQVSLRRRSFGWYGEGTTEFTVGRECSYDEDKDEYRWRAIPAENK